MKTKACIILVAFGSFCAVWATTSIRRSNAAYRRYPLDGLLLEQPIQGKLRTVGSN